MLLFLVKSAIVPPVTQRPAGLPELTEDKAQNEQVSELGDTYL